MDGGKYSESPASGQHLPLAEDVNSIIELTDALNVEAKKIRLIKNTQKIKMQNHEVNDD